MRDIIKRLPKLRGHGVNRARTVNSERAVPIVINLEVLETAFNGGDVVSPQTLLARKVISLRKGKVPQVKILGTGEITKEFSVSGCIFSGSAKEKIEKAGGKVL
jgi:large subunit ribosomal protein L15